MFPPVSDIGQPRLGTRRALSTVPGTLIIEGGRWPHRRRRVELTLEDVSVTGIGFLTHGPVELTRGQVVTIEVRGARSRVRVRHANQVARVGGTLCGAEFVDSLPQVLTELDRCLGS